MSGVVYGFDKDKTALTHAKKNYPGINFINGDISTINESFITVKFDLLFLFNVFYSLDDQKECCKRLASISKNSGILIIFDYTFNGNDLKSDGLADLSGKKFKPISSQNLKIWLNEANWELLAEVDIRDHYIKWYEDFLTKLSLHQSNLLSEFADETFNVVKASFQQILNYLKQYKLGGGVFYTKYNPNLNIFKKINPK